MGRVRGRHLLRWSKGGGESVANFSMVYARSALCDARFGQKAYGLRGFGRIGCVNQGVFGQKIGIGAKAAKRRGGCRERAGAGVAGAMTAGEGHEGDAAAGRGVNPRVSGRGAGGGEPAGLRSRAGGGEPAGLRSRAGGEPAGLRSGGGEPAGRRSGGANARGATVTAACVMRPPCGNGERERLRTCGGGECGQRSRGGCQARRRDELGRMLCRAHAPRTRSAESPPFHASAPCPQRPAFASSRAYRNPARSASLRLRSRALWPQRDPRPPFAKP